jgi:hypothetical protein
MRPVIAFLTCLLSITGCSEKRSASSSDSIHSELLRLASADPKVDFLAALERKDTRFIGIRGLSISVPGVSRTNQKTRGVRVIPGTSDAIRSEKDAHYQEIAIRYAETYNRLLLDHLRQK